LDQEEVRILLELNKHLVNNELALETLEREKGYDIETVINNEIGYDNGEYTIPVKDPDGKIVGVKRYDIGDKSDWLCDSTKYIVVPLEKSLAADNYGRNLTFAGIVIGKDLDPYLIPKEICMSCDDKKDKAKCEFCILCKDAPVTEILAPDRDYDVLIQFIGANSMQVKGLIRRHFKIPSYNSCRKVNLEITKHHYAEDIRVTCEIDYERVDSEYAVHKSYSFSENIHTNENYQFWGTTLAEPHTQHGIHVITKVKGARDSIAKWELTDEIREQLECFRASDPCSVDSIKEKINDITRDLALGVTKIRKRDNVIEAFNTVYHSPIGFIFSGNHIFKGWSECLIVGDTRTGKTETVRSMVRHVRAGEFLTSGENTTRAGILGGIQQTHSGRWTLTWGKIPMNDRGALAVDEADELVENKVLGQLSGVRSSGVAELVGIHSQKTLARTRLIWLSNPPQYQVSEHNWGVDIVQELFQKPQDISRLDFALVCSNEDVPLEVINQPLDAHTSRYTSEMCHNRVLFAWNIKKEDIFFDDGVEGFIYEQANRMARKYAPDIPLVLGAEMRIKIARGAISTAIQTLSTDDTCARVRVTRAHVEYYCWWLQHQYDKTAIAYLEYSAQKRNDGKLKSVEKLDGIINDIDKCDQLLATKRIQLSDAEDIFLADRKDAREFISTMRRCAAIKKTAYYYTKSPAFIKYLKRRRGIFSAQEFSFGDKEIAS